MKTVRVYGADLAYEQFGAGEKDLVFVHGFVARATGDLYSQLLRGLRTRFRITAIDMRGHGASANVQEHVKLDQMVADIVAVVEKLELDRPMYLGHSMGGHLGMVAVIKARSLFSSLAVLTPVASRGIAVDQKAVRLAVEQHRDPYLKRESIRSMFVRDTSEEILDRLVDAALLMRPDDYQLWLTKEWPNVNITRYLKDLLLPTLFVNGALDNVVPIESEHADAMRIPRCKEVIFSDEGHMLPWESPDRCSREVLRFYDDISI